jgi:hypothetical protein
MNRAEKSMKEGERERSGKRGDNRGRPEKVQEADQSRPWKLPFSAW